MTESEQAEKMAYFETLSEGEKAHVKIAVAKESRGEKLSEEEKSAVEAISNTGKGEDSGYTFAMVGTAAVYDSFLL